jgi:hypothetical protein
MSMSRRALGEGDRTVKDRDHSRRSSRARTMTASVDRPMGPASTQLARALSASPALCWSLRGEVRPEPRSARAVVNCHWGRMRLVRCDRGPGSPGHDTVAPDPGDANTECSVQDPRRKERRKMPAGPDRAAWSTRRAVRPQQNPSRSRQTRPAAEGRRQSLPLSSWGRGAGSRPGRGGPVVTAGPPELRSVGQAQGRVRARCLNHVRPSPRHLPIRGCQTTGG